MTAQNVLRPRKGVVEEFQYPNSWPGWKPATIGSMLRTALIRLTLFVAGFGLLVSALATNAQNTSDRGRKYKSPPPTARIEVTVLRDVNAKPIENAAVIFHLVGEKGNMELKTNEDGKAVIDVLPLGGKVRLQIIAKGFQTYGEDFSIDKAEMAIGVRMMRPAEQYSIYPRPNSVSKAGKDATPAPTGDKPAGAVPQPEAQPIQPQPK